MSEGAGTREHFCEEGFTSKELSRGVEAEEGGDREEESDGSQLRAGNPGLISNGEGEDHKDDREEEVPEDTDRRNSFCCMST